MIQRNLCPHRNTTVGDFGQIQFHINVARTVRTILNITTILICRIRGDRIRGCITDIRRQDIALVVQQDRRIERYGIGALRRVHPLRVRLHSQQITARDALEPIVGVLHRCDVVGIRQRRRRDLVDHLAAGAAQQHGTIGLERRCQALHIQHKRVGILFLLFVNDDALFYVISIVLVQQADTVHHVVERNAGADFLRLDLVFLRQLAEGAHFGPRVFHPGRRRGRDQRIRRVVQQRQLLCRLLLRRIRLLLRRIRLRRGFRGRSRKVCLRLLRLLRLVDGLRCRCFFGGCRFLRCRNVRRDRHNVAAAAPRQRHRHALPLIRRLEQEAAVERRGKFPRHVSRLGNILLTGFLQRVVDLLPGPVRRLVVHCRLVLHQHVAPVPQPEMLDGFLAQRVLLADDLRIVVLHGHRFAVCTDVQIVCFVADTECHHRQQLHQQRQHKDEGYALLYAFFHISLPHKVKFCTFL